MKNLVIVESPKKASTIDKFLDKDYKVVSSYGHVRDLPRGKLGVDVEHEFDPQYVIPTKVRKQVNQLKKEAEKAEKVILATDGDREGEAIAWHISQILDLDEVKNPKLKIKNLERIEFHEITKGAIEKALKSPRDINVDLVDAQQARRVLDRLVGYKLSPFLWKKIFRGLSAGRVQSVALRIIVDREEERNKFKSDEYWSVEAMLQQRGNTQTDTRKDMEGQFTAALCSVDEKSLKKLDIKTEKEALKIVAGLKESKYVVDKIEKKLVKRNPSPPFTTSTLQQESNKRLRFGARQTMGIAQHLYEKGLITYMRTDSVNLSEGSLAAASSWVGKNFGREYVLDKPRRFKAKSKLAQEAHEAIRPTQPGFAPKSLGGKATFDDDKAAKLYELIWRRFLASQLPQALFDATTVNVRADNGSTYGLRANGNIMRFDGFLKVWETKITEKELPNLKEDESLTLVDVESEQHFTEPPPRYNEASLIKALEEHGIGRPSTYAPTIHVIQDRNYVEKDESRRFVPTETGTMVNTLLTEHFPKIVDIQFTAHMEEDLDEIAEGKREWRDVIGKFYAPFAERLEKKYEEVKKLEVPVEETDEVCEKCGKPMAVKIGRFGKFLGCSGFPDCKTVKSFVTEENSFGLCPKCKEGRVIARRTKKRRIFYGCSKYPDCDHASWKKPGNEDDDNSGDDS